MAELVVVEAELAHGGGGVAAADDGERALRGDLDERLARARRVPAANGSISNAPIGPFQKTVRRVGELLGVELGRPRADVEAHQVGRDGVGRDRGGLGVGGELRRPQTTSTGRTISTPVSSARSR